MQIRKIKVQRFIMSVIIVSILMLDITGFAAGASKPLRGICATLYVDKSYGIKPTRAQLEQVVSIIEKRLDYKGIKKGI